jgi:hypothetical protein
MKKKVGLITYHASHNLGSLAQTYAMQYLIREKFKNNVAIIDFSNLKQRNMYSLFPKIESWKNIVKNLITLISYPVLKKRYDDFQEFIDREFTRTPRSFDSFEQLKALDGEFEILVCGSDQIWNINCTDFDDAYFLGFDTKARKVAYAVSLGGQNIINSDDVQKYRDYLADFDYISVRERNGQSWISQLTDKDVEIVADPTLLVELEKWESLVKEPDIQGDYIFFYGVPFSPETYNAVVKIGKQLAMPVIMLDARSYIYKFNFLRGIKLYKGSSPGDYFGLIKNAKLVITTSFHGTIFSTVFRKNFWTITFRETNKDDDRVGTLLDQLGMNERFIYLEDIDKYDLTADVDYTHYENNLAPLKNKSLEFLNKALS